jgi:hypothetical protein
VDHLVPTSAAVYRYENHRYCLFFQFLVR